MHRHLDRKGFLALSGATGLAAFLAACGGSDSNPESTEGEAAADQLADAIGSTEAAAVTYDPASEPDGALEVFTWAGYDDDPEAGAPWMWSQYEEGPYGSTSPLKFTFLEDDAQALSKVASGYSPDIVHPCMNYIKQWQEAGLISPLDTGLMPDWDGVPEAIKAGGLIDGQYYIMPFDVGFASLTYDADEVNFDEVGGEESWKILLDERYKGRMSMFSDPIGLIQFSHLMNEGNVNPNVMTSEQVEAAKQTALKWKPNMRNFWTSQSDAVNDFVNGNVVVTYTWPDGYWNIKNHKKMKGRNIKYMQPVEGRGVWVCGMVLGAQSERPGRAITAMASANTPQAAANLTDYFQYAAAQKAGVMDLIQDKALIEAFGIDDPSVWEPPKAWPDAPMDNQREVIAAGEEVKAS